MRDCIESIINQSYRNLQIILVDDGSLDDCPRICDEYACKDHRIEVIHKENGGLSDARNVGVDQACGKYISFVDSDDRIAEDMIESLYDRIVGVKADMSVCQRFLIGESGDIKEGKTEMAEKTVELMSGSPLEMKLEEVLGKVTAMESAMTKMTALFEGGAFSGKAGKE